MNKKVSNSLINLNTENILFQFIWILNNPYKPHEILCASKNDVLTIYFIAKNKSLKWRLFKNLFSSYLLVPFHVLKRIWLGRHVQHKIPLKKFTKLKAYFVEHFVCISQLPSRLKKYVARKQSWNIILITKVSNLRKDNFKK